MHTHADAVVASGRPCSTQQQLTPVLPPASIHSYACLHARAEAPGRPADSTTHHHATALLCFADCPLPSLSLSPRFISSSLSEQCRPEPLTLAAFLYLDRHSMARQTQLLTRPPSSICRCCISSFGRPPCTAAQLIDRSLRLAARFQLLHTCSAFMHALCMHQPIRSGSMHSSDPAGPRSSRLHCIARVAYHMCTIPRSIMHVVVSCLMCSFPCMPSRLHYLEVYIGMVI
jgi:hypothetical protein